MKKMIFPIFLTAAFGWSAVVLAQETAPPPLELRLERGPSNQNAGGGAVVFAGNATLVLKVGPFTILTDPNFVPRGETVELIYGADAVRLTDPLPAFDNLPFIDFLIVSHSHEDHFDRIARERIDKEKPILTSKDAAGELRKDGFRNVIGLEPWQSAAIRKDGETLNVTALPARHAPSLLRPLTSGVMGTMIDYAAPGGGRKLRVYISGDTLMGKHIEKIAEHFSGKQIDAAFLHLGAESAFGLRFTMDAEEGVEALKLLKPAAAFPIHSEDYNLFHSGLGEFKEEIRAEGYDGAVEYLEPGALHTF